MNPGQKVRVKTDPDRVGIITNDTRRIGKRVKVGVQFSDDLEFFLESALEAFNEESHTDTNLYAGRDSLRNNILYRKLSGRLSEVFYSMEASNTDFYAYQFKPVINLLNSPSNGILIADEVGLGKTIEAGLIWTELRSRLDASRLLVVCPAMLREKWRDELSKRFSIDARISDAEDLLDVLKNEGGSGARGFALICSKDGLRPPQQWDDQENVSARARLARFLDEYSVERPLFDLTIVDEAHYMRNPLTMTNSLGHLLRNVSEHICLLSATPVHLRSEELFHLLNIIDERLYASEYEFRQVLSANEPINRFQATLAGGLVTQEDFEELLAGSMAHPLLENSRQLKHLYEENYSAEELSNPEIRAGIVKKLESINLFSNTITRTRKREVKESRVIREPVPQYVDMTPGEEEIYAGVYREVVRYCTGRNISAGFLASLPLRQLSSSIPATMLGWKGANIEHDNDEFIDVEVPQGTRAENPTGVRPLLVKFASAYDDTESLVINDSKYQVFAESVREFFTEFPDEKILVFSFFKATVAYLQNRLADEGIACLSLTGGSGQRKFEVVEQFRTDPSVRVLIATEVASEGVDLQFCRMMVNYDLPWNPMKVEQRIGRLDRLGQKAEKIIIWNLLYRDTIDEKIYSRLHSRLKVFEQSVGGLEAILGEEIHKLNSSLFAAELTDSQIEERIQQTQQALANIAKEQVELEEKAPYLVAHSDYVLSEINSARRLNRFISDEDLSLFFIEYFRENYPDTQITEVGKTSDNFPKYDISLGQEALSEFGHFVNQTRRQTDTFLLHNAGREIHFAFRNKVSASQPDANIEIIDQFHPAIRFLISRIKQDTAYRHPRVAVKVSSLKSGGLETGQYAFFVKRWEITGIQSTEQLAYCATTLKSEYAELSTEDAERLVSAAATHGADWEAATQVLDGDVVDHFLVHCEDSIDGEYQTYVSNLERENLDKADFQTRTVTDQFNAEIRKIEERLWNLRTEKQLRLKPALEGKRKKAKERMKERLAEIEKRRDIGHSSIDVAYGVINVV